MEKGSTIKGVLNFVEENFGKEALQELLKEFPEDRAKELRFVLTFRWYPVEYFIELLNRVCEKFFNNDPSRGEILGRYLLKNTLPTLYRVFYRLGNPMFVVKKAPILWKMYHKQGEMVVTQTGDRSIEVIVRDYPIPSRVHCYVIKGGIEAALELSGAKNIKGKEEECVCEGASFCRYLVKWE